MWCREKNLIIFMYALRSMVKTLDWTTKFPRPNQAHVYFFIFPWVALYVTLVYLCDFSLLNPSVAYAGKNDENSACANSARHKGRFASKRRLSVLKNLARASEEKSQEKQNDTEAEDIEPPRKTVTRSKQVSSFWSSKL